MPKRTYSSAWDIESSMLSTEREGNSNDDTNIMCSYMRFLLPIEVFMLVNRSTRLQVGFMTSQGTE